MSKVIFYYNDYEVDINNLSDQEKSEMLKAFFDGGLSAGKDLSNIPDDKIKQGMNIEFEHLEQGNKYASLIARKIAIDHLVEDINYYEKLKEIEK
jgi:hypothetical protein